MNRINPVAVLLLIVAIPIAIYLGTAAAQAQFETILWIIGVGFFVLCLALGRHVWILIPATLGMKGGIGFLPGSPAPWHLMTLVVAFFFLLRWATRRQSFRFRWTWMETALLLVGVTLVQSWVRNPTGLAVLGGALAGGKPYFVYGAAFVAFGLIGMAEADLRTFRWAVIASIVVSLLDGLLAVTSAYSPEFAQNIGYYYTNVSKTAILSVDYAADLAEVRIAQFSQLGGTLALIACTFWRPVGALDLRKPWRILVAVLGVGFTALSGFRGGIVRTFINFAVGSALRKGIIDVIVVTVFGGLLIIGIAVGVPAESMPYSVQRVMTLVPGFKARSAIAHEAEGSAELRFEVWKQAWTSDRYISNKLFGDGFKLSAIENEANRRYTSGEARAMQGTTMEDILLSTGDYHGFHIETIRFTGIVGLIAATAALVVFAVFAWRSIQYYRDGKYWGYVLFICMPFLIHPFWYWLFYGSYKVGFPITIASAGMLKLLHTIRHRSKVSGSTSGSQDASTATLIGTTGQSQDVDPPKMGIAS